MSKAEETARAASYKVMFWGLMMLFIIVLAFVLGEMTMRILPIPGIDFHAVQYSDISGRIHYPGSKSTYRSERGDYIVNKVNRWGYLDVDHEHEKPTGIFRIGFFGDSYTEARQVPTDSTFFRQVQKQLGLFHVECLAFGISGFGTIQSYLLSNRVTSFFDLDMVVYVFYENDPGDQVRDIKRVPGVPYAEYRSGALKIDLSFRQKNAYKTGFIYRSYQFILAHSLLLQTLKDRLMLLVEHGVKTKVLTEDLNMSTKAISEVPNSNDLPSTWPNSWRNHASKLCSLSITEWRKKVEGESRRFAIIYVPRQSEWKKRSDLQDSWKRWLQDLCKHQGISFIDPTDYFWLAEEQGDEIFFDHFTIEGHKAFASAFVNWFVTHNQVPTIRPSRTTEIHKQ